MHADSVIVDGQRVSAKLFIVPSSSKPRSKELCFRSPNAGLKLELRADYDRGQADLHDELGGMDISFSVAESAEAEPVQQVQHMHVFCRSISPMCTCPVVFDPPAANATWVVRVKFSKALDSAICNQPACHLEHKIIEMDHCKEQTSAQLPSVGF